MGPTQVALNISIYTPWGCMGAHLPPLCLAPGMWPGSLKGHPHACPLLVGSNVPATPLFPGVCTGIWLSASP